VLFRFHVCGCVISIFYCILIRRCQFSPVLLTEYSNHPLAPLTLRNTGSISILHPPRMSLFSPQKKNLLFLNGVVNRQYSGRDARGPVFCLRPSGHQPGKPALWWPSASRFPPPRVWDIYGGRVYDCVGWEGVFIIVIVGGGAVSLFASPARSGLFLRSGTLPTHLGGRGCVGPAEPPPPRF